MWFCKENQAISQGEKTGMIISRETDNEMKYREETGNEYYELKHCKRTFFDLPKGTLGTVFVNELTKLINEWSWKWSNWDISNKVVMIMPSLI